MKTRNNRNRVIVRINADTDTVTVDNDHIFDRSQMDKASSNKLRRMIVDWFSAVSGNDHDNNSGLAPA